MKICKKLDMLALMSVFLFVISLQQMQIVSAPPYTNIDVDTAYKMIMNGAYPDLVILDVRTQAEFNLGHIQDAILIPHTELEERIGELINHKNDEMIVYCFLGGRSANACDILDAHSFTKVYNMLGGILAWDRAGYPIPRPKANIDIDPDTLNLRSEGRLISTYIELQGDYDVSDIDSSTIICYHGCSCSYIHAESHPIGIGDYDGDDIPDLIVKFNRTELTAHIYHTSGIKYGNVTLTVAGQLFDGTVFEGSDIVKVLFGGDINKDGIVNYLDLFQLLRAYWSTPDKPNWDPDADLDCNKRINYMDLFILAINYRATVP